MYKDFLLASFLVCDDMCVLLGTVYLHPYVLLPQII